MASEEDDLWHALLSSGQTVSTDLDFDQSHRIDSRSDAERYVIFLVGEEIYGIPIRKIEQILKLFPTTKVPRTSDFLVGIGNVKGTVMPVIDLALRLKFHRSERSRKSRVLIVRHDGELYGMIVDNVIGVISLDQSSLEEAPGAIGRLRVEYIESLARDEGKPVILLRLESILATSDFVAERFRHDTRDALIS